MVNKDFVNNLKMQEMVMTQLNSWELVLRKKELADSTIERKINNVGCFYMHLQKRRANKEKIRIDNISDLAFEYVSNGLFNDTNYDNEGTYGYRNSIYSNIKDGFKYIYEGKFDNDEIIKDLTVEQKEMLNDISKNKWFKVSDTEKISLDLNGNIQVKLLEELGIKIYFDENNKPYAFSHELAELISKNHKDVMKAIRLIIERYDEFAKAKKFALAENLDFSMVEDNYIYSTNNGGSKETTTYKLSKDLIIHYILGLTGEKYSTFKFEYQSVFNFIEEQHGKLLKEHAELKDAFLKMYNDIRKRNRDLLIVEHNKKCQMKNKSKTTKYKN